jgi:hypothetical protein
VNDLKVDLVIVPSRRCRGDSEKDLNGDQGLRIVAAQCFCRGKGSEERKGEGRCASNFWVYSGWRSEVKSGVIYWVNTVRSETDLRLPSGVPAARSNVYDWVASWKRC